jgi:hypothetical protein
MNRGQLILFACAACFVYLRAAKAGRNPFLWVALFVIGAFGCSYGSVLLIGAGSRIFTPDAEIEEFIPFARAVFWALMIGIGSVVTWLAGRPRTAQSELQPTLPE